MCIYYVRYIIGTFGDVMVAIRKSVWTTHVIHVDFPRLFLYAGIANIVIIWVVLLALSLMDRNFDFFSDQFSKLGVPGAPYASLFNGALIVVGLLFIVFSAGIITLSRFKVGVIGGAYMALAGFFLILTGIFPMGTYPHDFVALGFFVMFDVSGFFLGIEILLKRERLGLLILVSSFVMFPLAGVIELAVGWPSIAMLETYGLLIINIIVVFAYKHFHG